MNGEMMTPSPIGITRYRVVRAVFRHWHYHHTRMQSNPVLTLVFHANDRGQEGLEDLTDAGAIGWHLVSMQPAGVVTEEMAPYFVETMTDHPVLAELAQDMREWGKDDDGYEEGDEPEDPTALVGRTLYHVILATTWDEDAQQEALESLRDELDQSRGR